MIKKELDIKSIAKSSFGKALEQHGLNKKIILESDELTRKLDLKSLFPTLNLKKDSFSQADISKVSPNEQLFRKAFETIKHSTVEGSINNLNDKLGISVDENGSYSIIQNKNEKDIFAALAIINAMIAASEVDSKSTGLYFESFVAGMLGGVTIGYTGNVLDVTVSSTGENFSLKTIKGSSGFDLSVPGVVDYLLDTVDEEEDREFNLLVIRKALNESKKLFYSFYNVKLKKETFLYFLVGKEEIKQVGSKKEKTTVASKDKLQNLARAYYNKYYSLKSSYEKRLKDAKKPEERTMYSSFINSINQALSMVEDKLNDVSVKNFYKILRDINSELENIIRNNPTAFQGGEEETEGSDSEPETLGEAVKKFVGPRGVFKADMASLENSWKYIYNSKETEKIWKGSIILDQEIYIKMLQTNHTTLLNQLDKLFNGISYMLENTEKYFVDDNIQNKISFLNNATTGANKFANDAEKFKEELASKEGGQLELPLQERLNLTREAAIVMEMLQRMEE